MISQTEQIALTALRKAGDDSHAARIFSTFGDAAPPIGFATLYTAIDRLVLKGFVSERMSNGDERPKRLFSITRAGTTALASATTSQEAGRAPGDGVVTAMTIH